MISDILTSIYMGFTPDLNKQRLTMSQRTRMFGLVPHLLAVSKFNYLLNKVKVKNLHVHVYLII